ncbi:exopolysaccharide biosynthesis protein [Zavarzinia sp. CC-PAN008]|uniref:exopolysaccharide biosynthesis protein n=1 Tax=Zavarzinia sp. CC-PAN008 TaxID=3243332 RepID=UPI003F747AD2
MKVTFKGADAQRTSDVLLALCERGDGKRISMGDIVDGLDDRGFGILMLLLALPCTLPIAPPGVSAIAGLPLALVALQLVFGARHPWLPGFIRRRSFDRGDFRSLIEKSLPVLSRIERLLRPRLPFMVGDVQERVIAVLILVLALLLSTPFPFTNVPLSLAIVVLAAGQIEHDGLVLLIGIVLGVIAIGLLIWSAIEFSHLAVEWYASLSGWLTGLF